MAHPMPVARPSGEDGIGALQHSDMDLMGLSRVQLPEEHPMRSKLCLVAFAFLVVSVGTTAASAQSAIPDEAVKPNGAVEQNLALTAAQRNAIYNAVIRQRVRPAAERVLATVGSSVPPSIELLDLPTLAIADDSSAALLKYAMVESDIVVVDPISMRVVDVIHGGVTP
jgi:hypothetical protein